MSGDGVKKRVQTIPIFLLCIMGAVFGEPPGASDSASVLFDAQLRALLHEARVSNAGLRVGSARIDSLSASAGGVAVSAPPLFSFELMDASADAFPNPIKDRMGTDYSLEQMIMFPPKIRAMKRAEAFRVDMSRKNLKTSEQNLDLAVKETFFELYGYDRRIETTLKIRDLLNEITAGLAITYQVGMGVRSDGVRAESELIVLTQKLVALRQERAAMAGMLNMLCSRHYTDSVAITPRIEPNNITDTAFEFSDSAWARRSEIAAMQADRSMRMEELRRARIAPFPDIMVKGTYKNRRSMAEGSSAGTQTNPDTWSIMAGLTIPFAPWVVRGARSEMRRSAASIALIDGSIDEMRLEYQYQIDRAAAELASWGKRIEISRNELLPRARQTVVLAQTAYAGGTGEFTMMIDALRMELMVREEYDMAVMNWLTARARLDRVLCIDVNTVGGKK